MRHLALLALAGALALAGCGSDSAPSADQGEAEKLLERSFAKEVRSANFKLDLDAKLDGVALLLGKPLHLTIKGPFESNGDTKLPSLDWEVTGSGAGQSFSAGVVTTDTNAFIRYGGSAYEVGEDLISSFERQTRAQQEKNEEVKLEDFGFRPEDWLDDAEVSDGESIGGVATTKVSGKLDVGDVLRSFNQALESKTVKKQLGDKKVDGLSDDQIGEVEDAVDDPRFELNLGKADSILRRLQLELGFEVPENARDELSGLKSGSFLLELSFEDVNEPVDVTAPSDARPLSELLRQFGIPPELLLGAGAAVPAPQ